MMEIFFTGPEETQSFAKMLGESCRGGEVFELVGDVGSGKTTFVKGLALGLGVDDDVQSPSFTISRTYAARDGLELHHYDFYRLPEAGIMTYDVAESGADAQTVTVVEWAETVAKVLPGSRTVIEFYYADGETERRMVLRTHDKKIQSVYATWTKNR